MKHLLVVSPVPSHPSLQGNSARILRLCKLLQQQGHAIHFLYYGMEGLSADQRAAMEQAWESFHFLAPQGPLPAPSFGEYYQIDDWYDERVGELARAICRQWPIRACIVNYVWMSRALDALPAEVVRLIDTHDAFGDRHHIARAAGLPPVWFYTSKAEEAAGLRRADAVIAIQPEEKAYFSSLCGARVALLGHIGAPCFLTAAAHADEVLRVGYIGSGNPFNVRSLMALDEILRGNRDLHQLCSFVVAGTICAQLAQAGSSFRLLGTVEHVADFYAGVDVVMNPMVGGTGLKIKSLEAMGHGMALIATRHSTVGIDVFHEAMACADLEGLVEWLVRVAHDRDELGALRQAARKSYSAYQTRQYHSLQELASLWSHAAH